VVPYSLRCAWPTAEEKRLLQAILITNFALVKGEFTELWWGCNLMLRLDLDEDYI
jgi:hypothetical protein